MTKRDGFCFLCGVLFTVSGLTGAAKLADVDATLDRLGGQIDKLSVRFAMEHPKSSAVGDDKEEEPDLRRWSQRDTADNLYPPDDHAEFTGRRDSFDRRPSAEKGATP